MESYVFENTFGFTVNERKLEINKRFDDKVIWIDLDMDEMHEMEKEA